MCVKHQEISSSIVHSYLKIIEGKNKTSFVQLERKDMDVNEHKRLFKDTLKLNTNLGKGAALLFLFYISQSQ